MDSVFQYFKDIKDKKKKYNFVIPILIMLPALLGTLVPWIYYDIFGQSDEDPVAAQVLTWLLLPGMLFSVFLLQRYKLLGRYGDAVILLIPTFVWLLPEYVVVMDVLLYIAIAVAGVMLIDFFLTFYFMRSKFGDKHGDKGPMYAMVFAKLQFTLAAVLITISSSITLIDWGDAMGWLNKTMPDGSIKRDATGEPWIMFIAIVAILVVLFMIAESMFESILIVKYKGYEQNTTEISLSSIERFKNIKNVFKRGVNLETQDIKLVKDIIKDEVKKTEKESEKDKEQIKTLAKDIKMLTKESEKKDKELEKKVMVLTKESEKKEKELEKLIEVAKENKDKK